MRWVGSRVSLTGFPDTGTWEVTDRDKKGWCEIIPKDDSASVLANLSPTGKLWVHARDLTRTPTQQETLL